MNNHGQKMGCAAIENASLGFDTQMLRIAPYFECLLRRKLYLQATDGCYYRPRDGWPLEYAYRDHGS